MVIKMYKENKQYLNAYFASTLCALATNFFAMCVLLQAYGKPGEEDAEMILLFLWAIFVVCNVQIIIFTIHIKYRFNSKIGDIFFDAIMNFGLNLENKVKEWGKKMAENPMRNELIGEDQRPGLSSIPGVPF